ncbi:hypothetical protein F5884DRAFT_378380 [Xylogone sp. PMI_703]|nr:hypothetical protein F5884DRAFT_378380 [Xylogone sp. PMI_703]
MYNLSQLMGIVWTLWVLGLLTTIARIALRLKIQGFRFRAEDYLAISAQAFLTGLAAVITCSAPVFMITRAYELAVVRDPSTPLPLPLDVYTARTITALKLMFAQMLLFWSALWAGKFSLLVFFRRMVIGIPKYMFVWWAVFTLVLLAYLASMLSNFLTCVPLTKYWSATGCSDPKNIERSDKSIKFATSVDIVADFLIMLLPLRLVLTMKISLKQKLGLCVLFSLGIIVIVFAFIRLFNVTQATAESETNPTTVADGPILLSLWSMIEAAVAVVVANLPAFRTLLRKRDSSTANSPHERRRGYSTTIGSKVMNKRPAMLRRDMELESLHSFTEVERKHSPTETREITVTTLVSVESSERGLKS